MNPLGAEPGPCVPARIVAPEAAPLDSMTLAAREGCCPLSPVEGRLIDRGALAATTRDAMFALMCEHFDGVTRETFDADLAGKDHVILLEDEEGGLQGFSTLCTYESTARGMPVGVVYSGDTIVRREAWGTATLARTWIHAVRRLTAAWAHDREVYWLLLTSGFRTYRFLPVFYRWFYPRFDEATPAAVRALIDALAAERFGPAYDASCGVVRFARPQVLKPGLLDVPDGRRRDPHVACFLRANPGFVRGDELVCLTRLSADNLTAAGRRMMR